MIPFTLPGPPVQSDWTDENPDDDPLASLGLSDPPSCDPPGNTGAGTRTPTGPAVRPLFYSTAGVSARLGVSLHTVRKMIKDGRLKARKWGPASQAKWRIPADELDRLGDAPPPGGAP